MPLHKDLHDAEVVENREERRDEDDDRQNLKREDHAERAVASGPSLSPKTNWLPAVGVVQQRVHAHGCSLETA